MFKLQHNCTHLTRWVMLKILQARLQQYVNRELPDIQAGFRKGRGTREQIANIRWLERYLLDLLLWKKQECSRKKKKTHLFLLCWLYQSLYFCFIDYTKAFDCVDHNKLWKILQEMGIPDQLTCLLRICMQIGKQQLELDMEQQTGSKSGKEHIKAVYCHPAYLTFMQSTSCEMPGWMKHKLESRFLGEISITSDMQMAPLLWQKEKKN